MMESASPSLSAAAADETSLASGRYRIDALIGRGGVGSVYRAYDSANGTVVALKRLELRGAAARTGTEAHVGSHSGAVAVAGKSGARQAQLTSLFQREYQTLAQLAHPRIIEVYDYGVDDTGPFYTMELLDGQDLSKAGSMPWRRVCEVLRDVAAALTLLHSRRLLHRDISPRNVHCSTQGPAKLIDFGAMCPIGVTQSLVGTPQFVPPEALARQALDARADLYSLGAVGYYLLTGRPPYLARTFDDLRDAYRTPPLPPTAYVEDLPVQLSALVMRLISLDRAARPRSAVDVVERMTAIGGLLHDPRLTVASSYLTTPTLVGRDKELVAIRRRMLRAARGTGASLLVSGPPGIGLSRFLDACGLEGKLAGALVLRGTPGGAGAVARNVTRSLLLQLRAVLGESESERSALVLPAAPAEPLGGSPLARASWPPLALQPALETEADQQLSRALHDLVARIAAKRSLVILIDDFQSIDPASAADVLRLGSLVSGARLILVVGNKPDAPGYVADALRALSEYSRPLTLAPLTIQETEAMLSSVFGAVPNVRVLADRLHALSAGKPRLCIELAQHLVDGGVIRYEAGGFVLPEVLAPADLPTSLDAALSVRCARLSKEARALGSIVALCAGAPLHLEECQALSGHSDRFLFERALSELITSQMVVVQDEHLMLRQEAFADALTFELTVDERRSLHAVIADRFAGDPKLVMRAAEHFFHADEPARALDLLVSVARHGRLFMQWFPTVVELLDNAVRACKQLGRPASEAFWLRRARMHHALEYLEPGMRDELLRFADELCRLSGLAYWAEHPELADPQERLTRALQLAREAYERTAEDQRICAPQDAIAELPGFLASLAGYGSATFDLELIERIPSMAAYIALSPAIEVMEWIVCALRDLRASKLDRHVAAIARVLARLDQPDRAGLNVEVHLFVRLSVLYSMGLTSAVLGDPIALEYAAELEALPSLRSSAWRVRQIAHLHRGDQQQAEACRHQVEVMLIQQASRQARAGTTLETEYMCYAHMDDLLNLRRLLPELRAMAEDHPGWQPVWLLAQAELERIRGHLEPALALNERVLDLVKPGRHMMWPYAAGLQVRLLLDLGRAAEAKELGVASIALCEQHEMGALAFSLISALALAEAALGEIDTAIVRVDRMLERRGVGGMFAGLAYELRARLALVARDRKGFAYFYERCAAHFGSALDSPFTLNLARLRADALKDGLDAEDSAQPRASMLIARAATQRLRRELVDSVDAEERAKRTLGLVLETTGARGGHLYGVLRGNIVLLASAGACAPDQSLERSVRQVIERLEQVNDENTVITDAAIDVETGAPVEGHDRSGYELFPLANAGMRDRAACVIALRFDRNTRSAFTNEVLAAVAHELTLRSELSLFTMTP